MVVAIHHTVAFPKETVREGLYQRAGMHLRGAPKPETVVEGVTVAEAVAQLSRALEHKSSATATIACLLHDDALLDEIDSRFYNIVTELITLKDLIHEAGHRNLAWEITEPKE